MPRISWDEPGQRQFRTGLDRGVLYLPGGNGVPWNGLTSVSEGSGRSTKPYYIDGVKFLDHEVLGEWSGKLSAFTYPDELDALMGVKTFAPGIVVHDQPGRTFALSYRTLVGNELEGTDFGYVVHILYNVRALMDDVTHNSQAASAELETFSWTLTSTPPVSVGLRPTSHISVDTRTCPLETLELLEGMLYGTDAQDAHLPGFVDLLNTLAG